MDELHQDLLSSPIEQPQTLDQLWSAYMETKNDDFVLKIISVLDWQDRVRLLLEEWLKQSNNSDHSVYLQKLISWTFPINYEQRTIAQPLDLDLHVAFLARNGQLKFDELPVELSTEEIIRLSMKSAAVWSLLSMSNQDSQVAKICLMESRKPGGAARTLLADAGGE